MACFSVTTTRPIHGQSHRAETICDILKKIDKQQKEAVLSRFKKDCDNCNLEAMFNTKPIAIWTVFGRFEAVLELCESGDELGRLFRVEEVRDNDLVCLRVLKIKDHRIICTDETVILDCKCICAVQCFDSINCNIAPFHDRF